MRKSKRIIAVQIKDEVISRAFWVPLLHQHAFLTTMDEEVDDIEFGEVEMDIQVAMDLFSVV